MRLHSLTVQAIGPFAGRYTIDFAALSAGGLFLLEGPTGAGKSTVIDAVVFALYGKVASASASEDRLRSAFADEDVESVVDLCFETTHGVYRVRRTPAYDRAKKRGSGTVRQNATVKLWRLSGVPEDPAAEPVGEILSTRLDEAGAELTSIIGLDRTQFVQTMVLPQGEFAGFLRAEPERRRVLLQRIFGTEIYDRLEHQLDEERKAAQREAEAGLTAVRLAVERFCAAAGGDDLLPDQVEEDLPGVLDRVGELLSAVRESATTSAADAETAGLQARDAAERSATVADGVRRIERWRALHDERTALAARAPQIEQDQIRLDLARRAGAVAPLLRGWDEAVERVAEAGSTLDAAASQLPVGVLPGSIDAESIPTLTALRDRARDHVATLTRLVDLESGFDQRVQHLARMRAAVQEHRTALSELDQQITTRPQEREALTSALEAATELAHAVPAREQVWQAAVELLEAVRDLRTVAELRDQAGRDQQAAAAAALAAAERESDLRAARLRGIAGELAGTLTEGEPCPVCGAVDHPAPTPLAAGHVTAEQVQAAERQRQGAEERVHAAQSEFVALNSRATGLAERTAGRDLATAESEVDAAAAALERARSARTEQERCAEHLHAYDHGTEGLRAQRETAATELAAVEHAAQHTAAELERDRAEVQAALDGHPSAAARRRAERAQAEAAGTVLDAWTGLLAARDGAADWWQRVRTALIDHGFAAATEHDSTPDLPFVPLTVRDPADWPVAGRDHTGGHLVVADLISVAVAQVRTGTLPAAEAETLDAVVRDHRSAWDRVAAALAEPELAGLDADADLTAGQRELVTARSVAEEARARAEQAAGTAAVDRRRADDAATAEQQVRAAVDRAGELLRRCAPVTRMARLAGGQDGGQGLSLGTYVLQRRFEDVVAAANDRLRQMSDGRFELVTSHERETRSRKLGLAMRVVDHHSGDTRVPSTLSGGETFYVSLCLALGLADVVTAEAGGIELGTLFIDEGFGTLDPDTLDAVLAELAHLRAGGRVVGLVSHVEAMKTAIAERIAVRRRADGSSSLTVIAG